MKTQLVPQSHQRGFTYATTVITMILVGALLASYLKLVAHQNQQTMRSQAWNRTVAVLEAGIEEALAHLNKNAAPDATGVFTLNLTADGWTPNGTGGWFKTNSLSEDYYVVTISQFVAGNYYPFISAEGYVKQLPTFASRSLVGPFLATIDPHDSVGTSDTYVKRTVLCTTTNVPLFSKGLVAKDSIDLNGNNIRTDSYDSRYPAWSDNGKYPKNDPAKQRDNGDISCNGLVIDIGNADIYGRARTGPGGAVQFNANGSVGDKAWHAAGNTGIKPGWFRDDMNVELPDVTLPFTAGLPPLRNTTVNGVNYDYVFNQNGNYVTSTLEGKVIVTQNTKAKVVVTGSISLTGQEGIWLETGASLHLYMDGTSANLNGNGVVNPGVATNFYYFGTAKNTSIDFGGNGEFSGVLYAPRAAWTGNGGGNSVMDFCGSGVFKSVTLNGHYSFHYDEALPAIGTYMGYVITSWNEQ